MFESRARVTTSHIEPVVSVLLPARDAEATLGVCLRSVQRQTMARWECVIVDDGSRDGTAEVAARFAGSDPRFRLVSTAPRGLVAALTEGLAHCRGALVARMDADDVMRRDRLAAQASAMHDEPGLGAVGCHVRMFPREGLTDGRRAYEQWLNSLVCAGDVRRDALIECPVAHPALMIRRDLVSALGYREVDWAEDYDLVLRLLQAGWSIGMVPRRLVAWRDGPGRLSRVDPRYGLDRFTACRAAFLATGYLAASDTYALWGYGDTGKSLARALASHGRRPSHIVEVHPGRIGQRIGDARVVPIDALTALRGTPLVVSVAGQGPRGEIRAHLAARGFVELRDFVCAA